MTYKIKEKPEDFVVTEVIDLARFSPCYEGDYVYFWLKKKGYNTVSAVDKISRFLKCKARDVGFAGNKDKQAVTKQLISIKDHAKRVEAGRFEKFNCNELSVEYVSRGKKPVSLGDLKGNRFEIVIREGDKAPVPVDWIVNYFDEQRFSDVNKEVGKAIVKGELKKACEMIISDKVKEHLKKNSGDFVGALKKLPLKTRILYIHAYQSWLWNEIVKEYIELSCKDIIKTKYSLGVFVFPRQKITDEKIPIIGFGFEKESLEKKIRLIIEGIMKKEKINSRDFIIKQMPELSVEGGERALRVDVEALSIEKTGEKEYKLNFFLNKGSYATLVVKRMFA
jgi:tRNA pseudouridine13 synthase